MGLGMLLFCAPYSEKNKAYSEHTQRVTASRWCQSRHVTKRASCLDHLPRFFSFLRAHANTICSSFTCKTHKTIEF